MLRGAIYSHFEEGKLTKDEALTLLGEFCSSCDRMDCLCEQRRLPEKKPSGGIVVWGKLARLLSGTILFLIVLWGGATGARAAPFLISDPMENVVEFEVRVNKHRVKVEALEDGSLRFDLFVLNNGVHNIEIVAVGHFGKGPRMKYRLFIQSGPRLIIYSLGNKKDDFTYYLIEQ